MRILAVDDEKIALQGLVDAIEKAVPTAEIYGFRGAEEAIEYVRNTCCDVAFLDIKMRGMNGIDFAKTLKLQCPKINIIFTTGYEEYTGEAFGLHASGYVMKPITEDKIKKEIQDLRYPVVWQETKGMVIRTFGNFEVFINGEPLKFKYSKTKELFAYLVDRKGALCTNGELISVLWEDENPDKGHISYFKNIRNDLIVTLGEIGYDDILARQRGKLGILPDKVQCDYYDWLQGRVNGINSYLGEYMSQYTWSEFTNGVLEEKK